MKLLGTIAIVFAVSFVINGIEAISLYYGWLSFFHDLEYEKGGIVAIIAWERHVCNEHRKAKP